MKTHFQPSTESVVRLIDVGKSYVLRRERRPALQDTILNRLRSPSSWRSAHEAFWAVRHVDVNVAKGETLGFIGANGCGKSTLLKLMARTITPTEGRVEVTGRVAALLELGSGFHPELTGRENIFLNGSLMGLSRKYLDGKFDQIVEFAGVAEFIDMPVKHYSSGMTMRLAFAVSVNIQADILLIDEVLAVGDASFQRQCFERLEDLRSKGTTLVMVSHGMSSVAELCHRVVWIDRGLLRIIGAPADVISAYLAAIGPTELSNRSAVGCDAGPGS